MQIFWRKKTTFPEKLLHIWIFCCNFALQNHITDMEQPNHIMSNPDSVLYPTFEIASGQLPPFLERAISIASTPEQKDMLLLSTLSAVSYALPHIRFLYGDPMRDYFVNLMVAVIAPAASGKGVLSYSEKLLEPIDDYLRSRGKQAIFSADASSRAFFDILEENNSTGFILETEIDELANTWKQKNNNYSTLLRKSFEHETLRVARMAGPKGTMNKEIRQPHISMIISGTPKQLAPLMGTGENGLASRFMAYIIKRAPEFNMNVYVSDEREAEHADNPVFELLGQELLERWKYLSGLSRNIYWKLSPEQWQQLGEFFEAHHALRDIFSYAPEAYAAMVKRFSVSIQRIGAILAALRLDPEAPAPDKMYCCDEDFKTLVTLADTLIYHSAAMVNMLNEPHTPESAEPIHRNTKAANLLDLLPAEFTTSEANEIAESQNITKDTVKYRLKQWLDEKKIKRKGIGKYRKL